MSDDLKVSVLPTYGNTVCKTPNGDRAGGMESFPFQQTRGRWQT